MTERKESESIEGFPRMRFPLGSTLAEIGHRINRASGFVSNSTITHKFLCLKSVKFIT